MCSKSTKVGCIDSLLDGDIEPPRPKVKKAEMMIEEVSEKERLANAQQPTQTVYRTTGGLRITKEKAMESKKEELQRLNTEQLNKWGKGARQLEEEKEKAEYQARIKDLPLARYEVEPETDEILKSKPRFGDPMQALLTQPTTGLPAVPKCKFKAPPNRYGIEPGVKWDGVDRSNGFETRLLLSRNEKKSNEADAYRWRTEDL